jgi:hypothetical protein
MLGKGSAVMKLCKQTMINSYNWTSFSPEKRGEADFNYYSNLLAEDLKTLGETPGNYERKFIERVMLIYARQSRCASPMITGPANFNNRRNGKAWDSKDRAIKDFEHWRNKYLKSVTRERTLSPEEEIDKTLEELERMEAKHDFYKALNKIKDPDQKRKFAEENGYLEVLNYWSDRGGVIPSFHLTNHNAQIKARKKKLEIMRARIERKQTFEGISFPGGKITIENDRVVISHDSKPSRVVIDAIKGAGFRYSPKTATWVRKHTGNAIEAAKNLLQVLSAETLTA